MSKPALKAAKAFIGSKDWEKAKAKSVETISFEPENYYAHVFLGLSLFNLKAYDESERAYREAVRIEQAERQKKDRKERLEAWQGLLNLYENQEQVSDYVDVAVALATIYRDQDDRTKCQTIVDKVIPFVKEHGSRGQYKRALHILLPGSPVYDYLEGVIPRPDQTYPKLIEIVEAEEMEKINKEIANRRSRLGAVYSQVTTEVRREVWGSSPLEELYQLVLDWSDDEEVRRQTDTKLLQHGYDKLIVLRKEEKLQQRLKVENWARGLVILKYPFELAWKIVIEWKDCESIAEHDVSLFREYTELFPDSGLSKTLAAYLKSEISPFPPQEPAENEEKTVDEQDADRLREGVELGEDDILDLLTDGVEKDPSSIISHRILAEYYLYCDEHENAIDVSRGGQRLAAIESQKTGLSLQKNRDALAVFLATGLIHFQSPKHHGEAQTLFDGVLKHNRNHGGALVGLGLILEERRDFTGAAELLKQALALDSSSVKVKAEAAWCEVLKGNYTTGKKVLEECLESCTGIGSRSLDLKAQVLWRIGTAMWNHDESSRGDRKGPYGYFLAALQKNQNFAPAYTSLGCFYEDVANDPARANKCFQRAFEISPGEIEAAERLAKGFAESREWDLVEIVARRVIEAEKKRFIPGKGASWPQSAIGVVELNRQNHSLAIRAFQAALRLSPDDFHSWIGLGESYATSGKHMAALKVFRRAEVLDPDNWFAKYMIANVQRDLGEFEGACKGYREVLAARNHEVGVLIALSETLLSMGWHSLETGYYGRAIDSAIECLDIAELVLKERSDAFNIWKTIGDACMLFTWIQSLSHRIPVGKVVYLLSDDFDIKEFDIMSEVDEVGQTAFERLRENVGDHLTACAHLGILAYKRAIYASASDRHAHAVAWFNLGTAEYRAHIALSRREMRYRLAAIRCFKRTIKLEPGNHEFWNALGVTIAGLNPKVAQHAIVRALYINDKNARVWTNLGTLYAQQEDYELANEAFSRAQSTDPEYALAWVGQGIIATIFGEENEAQGLFQHAFEISDQASVTTKRLFAMSKFDGLLCTEVDTTLTSLLTPIFAIRKLQAQISQSPILLQIGALFDERVADFSAAQEKLELLCTIYEQRYEEDELEESLAKYAQSKAELARVQLGLGLYPEAIENASLALDLSGEIKGLETSRLSAHLTAGMAHYYTREMSESLDMFKSALIESDENPDVVCLLSQVLWAKGGEEEREVAKEQLFATVEAHPNHVDSLLLLGAMGVMEDSVDVLEAVVGDLRAFRGNDRLPRTDGVRIDNLLTAISQVSQGNAGAAAAAATAAESIFIKPGVASNWSQLAEIAGNEFAAETALKVAQLSKENTAEELAKVYTGIATIGGDLRAVFLAPWKAENWNALKEDVQAS